MNLILLIVDTDDMMINPSVSDNISKCWVGNRYLQKGVMEIECKIQYMIHVRYFKCNVKMHFGSHILEPIAFLQCTKKSKDQGAPLQCIADTR